MSNVVGKQVRVFGRHIGKVIAETFENETYYANTYLVLLNSNGINIYRGWNCNVFDDTIRKKLCGKYGKNLNNFFYFFRKVKESRFEFFENKTMENE